MNYPMREKYTDQIVGGVWFEFGVHENGHVDIANESGDVFTDVPQEKAAELIKLRDDFLAKLYKVVGFDAQKD